MSDLNLNRTLAQFDLVPFSTDRSLPQIKINGQIERDDEVLAIEYRLTGDLDSVTIPELKLSPSRQLELWEATCFEFFIGIPGDLTYWEFNLAPSGDWNVYHLDDYRQGLQQAAEFTSLPLTIDLQKRMLTLSLTFDLSKIIPLDRDVEIAITSVIKSNSGDINYWALTHTGTEADFHRRDSFIIALKSPSRA